MRGIGGVKINRARAGTAKRGCEPVRHMARFTDPGDDYFSGRAENKIDGLSESFVEASGGHSQGIGLRNENIARTGKRAMSFVPGNWRARIVESLFWALSGHYLLTYNSSVGWAPVPLMDERPGRPIWRPTA